MNNTDIIMQQKQVNLHWKNRMNINRKFASIDEPYKDNDNGHYKMEFKKNKSCQKNLIAFFDRAIRSVDKSNVKL